MKKSLTPAEVLAVKLLYKERIMSGDSQRVAAEKVGISEVTACKWFAEMGLKDEVQSRFTKAGKENKLLTLSEFVAKARVRFPHHYPAVLEILTDIHRP